MRDRWLVQIKRDHNSVNSACYYYRLGSNCSRFWAFTAVFSLICDECVWCVVVAAAADDDGGGADDGTGAHPNWVFSFEVKFYPLDAAALREDYTRCD